MKFLGIDYGTKRIGLAISDEGGTLAFPKEIILNDSKLFDNIDQIVKEENISEIVIGESFNFSGQENSVAEKINVFISELEKRFELPVHRQSEFLTSVEARRYDNNGAKVDAGAAALILQRYLDRRSQQRKGIK